MPTLWLNGDFKVGRAAFRDLPVTSAQSHVTYSNMVWHLTDLVVTRPEGSATLDHWTDSRTQDYYWRIHSGIDVKVIQPLLEAREQRVLDRFRIHDATRH